MVALVRKTAAKWNADDGWLYAAAVAAFAALAIAPLFLVALRVAEAFGERREVLRALALLIDPIVGRGGVRALVGVVNSADRGSGVSVATAVGAAIALFAGSRLFYAVQRALHAFWGTPARRSPNLATTALSFFGAGVLAVVTIAGLATLIFGSALLLAAFPHAGLHGLAPTVARAGVALAGMLILTPIVAALFRWLPGARFGWRDVWVGALVTSAGFAVAQFAISLYLASVNLPWTYGSAASVVVMLLWCYYSSYLFLLGAEFTFVYADERPSTARARAVTDGSASGPNGEASPAAATSSPNGREPPRSQSLR
jgi:membrane protein